MNYPTHFPRYNSVKAEIAWPGLIGGIVMLVWAWWLDRHREPIGKHPKTWCSLVAGERSPAAGSAQIAIANGFCGAFVIAIETRAARTRRESHVQGGYYYW